MTITAAPVIKNGCLMVRGKVVLTGVPDSVVSSPLSSGSAFLGANPTTSSSCHAIDLGILENCKFMCLFIAKIWWMIPRIGTSASEIPLETQMLLMEVGEDSVLVGMEEDESSSTGQNKFYVLVLAVLDGDHRTTLQGTPSNMLQFYYESGCAGVETSQALEGVFINSGENPFELIKDSIKILSKHKGTFTHLENKKAPAHLDWFGWCTWDAFYTEVTPKGIKEGLQSFKEGGFSPKFLIIDDGWQETVNEFQKEGEPHVEGTQFASRLADIKENTKFRSESDDSSMNLKELIHSIKEDYGLKYVYMWHALAGYWGGACASSEALKKYNPKLEYPVLSQGNVGNIRDIALDSLEKYGVGVIDPQKIFDFYNDMHSYLASSGVDGVKVDVQNLLETLGSGYGGRVSITKRYHEALEESIERNFGDNNLISWTDQFLVSSFHTKNRFLAVMTPLVLHCLEITKTDYLDSMFSSKKSATARASEDFMPNEPSFQTMHIATVSFNSLLLGEVVVPDWDMFHSNHSTAEFHGAARAIGGCPVYVSDKPGKHDFKILRKLVLPDGSILRARYAGRPTRDSLFVDPVMDGKSLLKIWNLNKLTGVVGVFNCQGVGSWPMKQSGSVDNSAPAATSISGRVRPHDVEFLEEIAGENWTGDAAVYAFNSGTISRVAKGENLDVQLGMLQCEIFTVSPIKILKGGIEFAPIGLINMYNSGGAVEECVDFDEKIKIKARGGGVFGAYSSIKPSSFKVDMKDEEFTYNSENGLLIVYLQSNGNFKDIQIAY